MAKQVKLKVEPRTSVGRSAVRKLKARGVIPAIIYGGKDKPQPLQVSARDINAMMSHASGENVLVELEIAGEKSNRTTGIPNGVKNFGGLLEQSLRALTIECLPSDLPDRITVDVSQLNIGDSIHVRQIQLPSGVTSKVPPDLTAFSVLAPTVEEEPVVAEAAEAAAAGPEVITEKKPEGEAAAPAAKEKAPKEKEQKK